MLASKYEDEIRKLEGEHDDAVRALKLQIAKLKYELEIGNEEKEQPLQQQYRTSG